jgi:hypothetical protein
MPFDFPRTTLRPANRQPTRAALQNIWCIAKQTVIAGDCLVEMKALAAASIDVVVTSPPYNESMQSCLDFRLWQQPG